MAKRTVETLSKNLRMTYPGREGYSVRNLNYMKQFARRIPSGEILHQGGAKLMELQMDELDLTAAGSKVTYEEIKTYVLEHLCI